MGREMKRLDFRSQFSRRAEMIGTFVKLAAIASVEALGRSELDFIVLDQEHAPLDRALTDTMLLAAIATDLPALVRVPSAASYHLQSALDSGAAGVLVPHVDSGDVARSIANACRYANGRGYSGATRLTQGGRGLRQTVTDEDRAVIVIVQVEDLSGLDNVEAIAACDGIDGIFIGRADLAVAMGADAAGSDVVWDAARRIAAATLAAGKVLSGFAATVDDAEKLKALGASLIVSSSDQAWLTIAANQAAKDFRR
jgi:2-keto-3-deoxy-L-rhamnonate aldolase RhmA